MNYSEVKQIFRELKRTSPRDDLTAHIIFTKESFATQYPLLSRTYCISSDNKAFWPNMGGYSIFGCCLDGRDPGVRLDWCMAEEGHPGGWRVEDCYILERMKDTAAISDPDLIRLEMEDGTICYCFGETCVRLFETRENGKIRLEPLAGNQAVAGKWVDLTIDRIHGYCTLLERYLNKRVST